MPKSKSVTYFEAARRVQRNMSIRKFAMEVGLNESTASRLLHPDGPTNSPSLKTHRTLVQYARSHEMAHEALDLERAWERLSGQPESDFQRVFGREIAQGHVSLVLPLYRLNPKHLPRDENGRVVDDLGFFLKDGNQSSRPGGIGHATVLGTFNDLQALLAIHHMLAANSDTSGIHIEGDTSFAESLTSGLSGLSRSAVVVGLHANRVAAAYASQPEALVQVARPDKGTLGAIIVDGQPFRNSGAGIFPMFFVIARVLADPTANEDRICVICAGTTGTATLKAGQYLRDDWQWFTRFAAGLNVAAVYCIAKEDAEPSLELVKSSSSSSTDPD